MSRDSSSGKLTPRSCRDSSKMSSWLLRPKLVILALLLWSIHAVSGRCGVKGRDPKTLAVSSDVVFEAKVEKILSSTEADGSFKILVKIRKSIYKGAGLVDTRKRKQKMTIGYFKTGKASKSKCLGNVVKGRRYMFFLKNMTDGPGVEFRIHGLPLKPKKTVIEAVTLAFAEKPKIRKVQGPKGVVKAGNKRTIIKCKLARGMPRPVFEWYKDGMLIRDKSTKGVVIQNKRKYSKLKISRLTSSNAGNYTCVAKNLVGEDSESYVLKVKTTSHERLCSSQTFCLNGGTCYEVTALSQERCSCTEQWAGRRCEMLNAFGVKDDYLRQAKLDFERVLITIGVVVGVLVLLVIFIASYLLAKRRREEFHRRQKIKTRANKDAEARLTERTDPTRLATGNMTVLCSNCKQKTAVNLQTNHCPPVYPVNAANAVNAVHLNSKPHHGVDHIQSNSAVRSSEVAVIGLTPHDEPVLRPPRPNSHHDNRLSRGRLVASSYDNTEVVPLMRDDTDDSIIHDELDHGDYHDTSDLGDFEMQPVVKISNNNRYENVNKYKPQVSERSDSLDMPPPPPPTDYIPPPTSISLPAIHSNHSEKLISKSLDFSPTTHTPSSFPSPPSSINECSSNPEEDPVSEPFEPSQLSSEKSAVDYNKPIYITDPSSEHDLLLPVVSPIRQRRDEESGTGYDSDNLDNDRLFGDMPHPNGPSHSHTFPKAKGVNGNGPAMFLDSSDDDSDDDSEEDSSAATVPYEQHKDELHISEDDLDLSQEGLIGSSFNSILTPSRQVSYDDGGATPLIGKPPIAGMKKHQSEDVVPSLMNNKRRGSFGVETNRSRSLDTPYVVAHPGSHSNHSGVNSTLAGGLSEEGLDSSVHADWRNQDCPFDPSDEKDNTPWDIGEVCQPADYNVSENLREDEQDRNNRLKHVCPEQEAIPI